MKVFELKGQKRTKFGKKATKAFRKQDVVPCVIYGKGAETVHFSATTPDLRKLIYTGDTHVVRLDLEGDMYDLIMQEIQFNPVTDKVVHLDFLLAKADEPVKIELPVKTVGLSEGVKAGGVLNVLMRRLKVKGLIADMPEVLEVDVTDLKIGKTIKCSELNFNNLQVLNPKDAIICNVSASRAAKTAAVDEKTKK
jgi:large subunit ribosomal protein L25